MTKSIHADSGIFAAVDPFRCRLWHLHDRLECYLTLESCRDEMESIGFSGQLVPAIGRCVRGDPDVDVEIICGARRLFVARQLRIPLRVQIREMTDQEAAAAMESENRLRRDISPYERGICLEKLLKGGVFKTQEEMAKALHLSPVQVSRLLKFTELPALLINAFANPREILESWAIELHKAWHDDRNRLVAARACALSAKDPSPTAAKVYEILIAPAGAPRGVSRISRDPIIKAPTGQKLLRIVHRRKELAVAIPNELVTPELEYEVTQTISAIVLRHMTIPGGSPGAVPASERTTPTGR